MFEEATGRIVEVALKEMVTGSSLCSQPRELKITPVACLDLDQLQRCWIHQAKILKLNDIRSRVLELRDESPKFLQQCSKPPLPAFQVDFEKR